jgi:glucokinase-like ROK family protein
MHKKQLTYGKKVVKQLYFSGTLSCADLSNGIKKSLPLTNKILASLIKDGTVEEKGYAPSSGGRRPLMYSVKQDVLNIVAVAMDQQVTRISIMDMHNRHVTAPEKLALPLAGNEAALPILSRSIANHIKNSGVKKNKLIGIGIGMPGFIDVRKGVNHTFLETRGKSIIDVISDETRLPVFIDNDSRLIALAEMKFGGIRHSKDAMVINLGWGVGLGMILNGELFRGHNGFAGEFSHIPLFYNGKLCSCGKRGCLETEASMMAVVAKAQNGLKSGRLSVLKNLSDEQVEEASEVIVQAARKGDQFAVELLSEAGYNIGRGIATLIHLLNPETILISGRGSIAGKIWQAPIQQALNEHCIPRLSFNTSIEISTLGYDAELIGAAALVMENYEKELLKRPTATKTKKEVL